MNTHQIASIRALLLQKKENLQISAHLTAVHLKTGNVVFADPIDHAAEEIHKDIELNCRNKEWHQLLDIQETLLRMERGFFGICDHCGRKISNKRLKALPMTRYCVTCQAAIEVDKENRKYGNRTSRKAMAQYA